MTRSACLYVGAMLLLVGISLLCEPLHGSQIVRAVCVTAEGGLMGFRLAVILR